MKDKEIIERALFSDTSRYKDIMNKPRHISRAHLQMPQIDRAAQFAPFAALTGYHKLLAETAERYQRKTYPSLKEKEFLAQQLDRLAGQLPVEVKVEYFDGQSGYYQTYKGYLQKIDYHCQRIILAKLAIPIASIRKISVQKFNF